MFCFQISSSILYNVHHTVFIISQVKQKFKIVASINGHPTLDLILEAAPVFRGVPEEVVEEGVV